MPVIFSMQIDFHDLKVKKLQHHFFLIMVKDKGLKRVSLPNTNLSCNYMDKCNKQSIRILCRAPAVGYCFHFIIILLGINYKQSCQDNTHTHTHTQKKNKKVKMNLVRVTNVLASLANELIVCCLLLFIPQDW